MSPTTSDNWLDFLFDKVLVCRYGESVAGDLYELYLERIKEGKLKARVWLLSQVALSLGPFLRNFLTSGLSMVGSYLVIAWRNLNRNRIYTVVNVVGLALGLSAFILILLYLQFEYTYDRFHPEVDRIYRVSVQRFKEGRLEGESHVYTPPIGHDLKEEFPEVEQFTRLTTARLAYLRSGESVHKEPRVRHASPGLLSMFSFPLIAGDPASALNEPFSMLLTRSAAVRMFGDKDPMGEAVGIGPDHLYQVTGVMEDPPANSTIQFDVLISFSTLYRLPDMYMDWNGGNQYISFVRLTDEAAAQALAEKLPPFMWRHINEAIAPYGWENVARLQPMKDIHFYHDASSQTALTNFYTFAVVAALILLIACINFVNLTTARAARRAREVGLRKVMGARKGNLVRQFLLESILLTGFSFILGIVFVYFLTPVYGELLDRSFSLSDILSPVSVLGLAVFILVVGTMAGMFPAFYMSAFEPVKIFKGGGETGRGKRSLRNILVVFQFTVSITLMLCTFLVHDQLQFLKQVDPGFEHENVLVIPLADESLHGMIREMRNELLAIPGITHVSASSDIPYKGVTSNGYIPEGHTHSIMIHLLEIDENFNDTFGVEMVAGRNFSSDLATDSEACLINETLARQLDWVNPIGKTIHRNGDKKVIGVVRDFHFATLHDQIGPLLLTNRPEEGPPRYISARIIGADVRAAVAGVKDVLNRLSPQFPFEYFFLDAAFDNLYKSEERFQKIFLYFSWLAICIALLGLFSLAAYTTQQKNKEVGIRKVLGASMMDILTLLSRDIVLLVLLANMVAVPLVVYVMDRWLDNFAYRSSLDVWAFVWVMVGSLLAAQATILYQALRSAMKKPVEELRVE